MESQSIAKNLIYQRKLKGYSQEELSSRTQVTVRTIQRIEKSEVTPHLQTVKLLATALEIEVDQLLVLEDPKEENLQKKWLLLLHATPILGLVIPFCNVLFPLFLWIHKREDNKIYHKHGRAIVNFQITMTILFLVSLVTLVTVKKYGVLFFFIVVPYTIIVSLVNIISAMNSQKCFFPLAFPFLKNDEKSKGLAAIVLLFSFVLNGCSAPYSQQISRLDGTTISYDSLTVKIKQLMNDANVHGAAVSIINNNEVTYQHTFGYKNFEKKQLLNDSTNIYGGSLSKAVFSVLVMKLVEEKIIDLDRPLESYLPKKIHKYKPLAKWHDDFSDLRVDTLYHKITARMCLNHTTGFPNWRWYESDHKLRVNFEPGSRYSYSGEGFVYLQVILEKILGKRLEELVQEKIFGPLEMERSSYQWSTSYGDNFAFGHTTDGKLHDKDTDNEPRAGSTLETTASDYSKFLLAVLGQEIISKTSWDELFKPQIRIRSLKQFGPLALKDSTLNDNIKLSYGLGWGLLQTPYGIGAFKECHADGFQHYSIVFPDEKKGVMIMTNSDNGEDIFKELLEVTMADTYTPWEWGNYIPYNQE